MPHCCCVPKCNGNYRSGPRVHAFKFPKDEERQRLWLRAIKRENYVVKKSSKVCGLHFRPEEILWTTSGYDSKTGKTITVRLQNPRLAPGIIPSLFPLSSISTRRTRRKDQADEKTEEKSVDSLCEGTGPEIDVETEKEPHTADTSEAAKSKWRSLRDYYRHEQRKAEATKSGEYKSPWNQYERLGFLRDSVQRGKRLYNLLALQANSNNNLNDNNASNSNDGSLEQIPIEAVVKLEYEDENTEQSSQSQVKIEDAVSLANIVSPEEIDGHASIMHFEVGDDLGDSVGMAGVFQTESPPLSGVSQNFGKMENCVDMSAESSGRSRRFVRKRAIGSSECLELKRRKVSALEKLVLDNENDDLQFFKSLIPDLKDLPRYKKACIRLKIQEVIYKEIYGEFITNN